MSREEVVGGRYCLLDAWRGIAALSVLGFHAITGVADAERNWVVALLWQGWAGVFIFFPISGYCILAATRTPSGRRAGAFLRRRWYRIFPTYWASIGVAVALLIVFAPLSRGSSWDTLTGPGLKWLSIFTLTQTFVGADTAINPVYWSLCYEEQFYLIIAATLLCRPAFRPTMLLGITVVAAATYCVSPVVHVAGLFIDRWLSFAVGLAVFGWFDSEYGRPWALVMFGVAIATELITLRVDLGISLVVSIIFLAARRHDAWIASMRPVRWLAGVGAFSYSLYLIHFPIARRIVNLARRVLANPAAWWIPVTIATCAAAIAAAAVFNQLVEQRFQRSRSQSPNPSLPAGDVALA